MQKLYYYWSKYKSGLENSATFSGRARRREYWFFVLFNIIIFVLVSVLFTSEYNQWHSAIFSLFLQILSIAVGVRRMHDVGKSGWFLLIPIYNLILACTDGVKGENEYGADPKANV